MTVHDLIGELELSVCCGEEGESREITGGYAGDLLSDVMANSRAGNVWVTMQVHVNIVAVAILKELAAIILVNGRRPAEDTLTKAKEENITILSDNRPAYELIGRLHAAGVGLES
jgi:serine kinase of HPr protein (carbohydrate metabolism regulator)